MGSPFAIQGEAQRMTTDNNDSQAVRTVLDNGLTVIVLPQHDAPIGSFWIWYRVGGRNEVEGVTGVSHWAEHMLFKGTETLGKGEIFKTITANGGTLNGFTWIDYTAYYETLPIDRIDIAFDIEADRMVNARFDPDEVASERTVIISERQGNENSPTFLLSEEVGAAAFKAHPYGHGVIGHMSDLRSMTREDLYGHYRTFYRPNNAVAVFVGDLTADEALRRIEQRFGGLERGPEVPEVRTTEPEQFGERRVIVRRPAPNQVIQIAYHSPPASHADIPALIVLDAVLSGGKPMSFGGGAGMGRSSRLYRALVTTELASSAGSSMSLSIDPYLFGVSATLRPDVELDRVEQAINEEIGTLQHAPAPASELNRVMKQIRAQFVYSQQSVSSKAYLLGALALVAPDRTPESLIAEIEAVTAEDVQRVASTYLTENNRTVGVLIPTAPSGPVPTPSTPIASTVAYVPDADDLALDESMPAARETVLENGIRVLTLDSRSVKQDGPVVVRLRLPVGSALDDDQPGVARFATEMLTRGSAGRTLDDLAEELDGLGASITAGAGRESIDIVATSLREDADRVASLMADAVLRPDFPDAQAGVVRGQILSGLRQARNDTRSEAEHRLRQLLYPEGHPYRGRVAGDEASVEALTRDDLVEFHDRAFKASGAIAAVAGAIDHEQAVDLVRRHLGAWNGTPPSIPIPRAEPMASLVRDTGEIPGKSQADVALGVIAIDRSSPDYYAFTVANLIFGRLGLMGRIGESVRERQGMAYYAFSGLDVGKLSGFWSARAGVNPDNIERAVESVIEELRLYLAEGPTQREYSDAIGFITGSLPMALETAGSISALLAEIAFHDLGLDYLKRYRGIIRSLTPDTMIETMRRYVDPERLAVVVVQPGS